MTTIKSSSNDRAAGLFSGALRRQLGFMIAASIFLFIITVVPYLVSPPDHTHRMPPTTEALRSLEADGWIASFYEQAFASGIYFDHGQAVAIAVILSFFAFACALSSARYMHSMKMSDLYHSLPVRRERWMLTNLAASMAAVLGPLLILTLCTMLGILIAYGGYGWVGGWFFGVIAADFLTIAVVVLVMYTFTTFIAVQVGNTFDAFALTCALGFLPTAVYLISGAVWQSAIYGAVFNPDYALVLSPFLFYFELLRLSFSPGSGWIDYAAAAPVFLVWALIGAGLFWAATLLYRRRKSELAGQTQPQGHLQMITKFFVAFCGAAIFLAIFYDRYPLFGRVFVILLATVFIGLLAELILSRGVRSIVKNAKWLAVAGLAYSLLYLGVQADILGHTAAIPQPDRIVSVSIDYRGRFESEDHPSRLTGDWQNPTVLTAPESTALVREVHAQIIQDHLAEKTRTDGSVTSSVFGVSWSSRWGPNQLSIQYLLADGRTFERRYTDISDQTFLLLTGLEDRPDFIAANHPLFFMEEYRQTASGRHPIEVQVVAVPLIGGTVPLFLSGEDAQRLIGALQEDMLRKTLDEILNPAHPALGFIELSYHEQTASDRPGSRRLVVSTLIPVTQGDTSTLSLLQSLGAIERFAPETELVHEILITDFGDGFWLPGRGAGQNQVISLNPSHHGFHDLHWYLNPEFHLHHAGGDSRRVFSVTGDDEIAHLLGRVHSTLLTNEENAGRALYMQIYGPEQRMLSAGFVLLGDLPASVRGQVAAYLEERARARAAA